MKSFDEYRKCVKICNAIDFSDKSTVWKNNRAVERMYEIVSQAERDGANAIQALSELLKEPACAIWLAHQLVERATISKSIEDRCFEIIERLASGDGAEALGNNIWLKEWRQKKGR